MTTQGSQTRSSRDLRDAPLSEFGEARVLVVDDQPANIMVLERLLRTAGIGYVETLDDPREAVARCLRTEANLVLLDLHMPHVDGFEVLADLQASLPAESFVPVVVLTADNTTETRDRALAAGATDFLTKPFDHSEVLLRLRNLLKTWSLYQTVQRHNTALRADLDARRVDELRRAAQHKRISEQIDQVLASDAINMIFQPIADVCSGQIVGFEALARFKHEPYRPPNEWFDDASTVGRSIELEFAAARAALSHLDLIRDDLLLSLNLSPSCAGDPSLPSLLAGFPMERLVLEITEHAPIDDYTALLASLGTMRAKGLRIAVDDAGAGYAGLRHILRLRPDIIKLDIALTTGIDDDPARRALATGLAAFAEEIQATIIAEGIETRRELQTLQGLGIPWGQGYYLARPGPLLEAGTKSVLDFNN